MTKTTTSRGKNELKAIKEIEKKYGKGSVTKGNKNLTLDLECVSTGSYSLDCAVGGKGIPFGRIIEIFGPESSGKTTLALHLLANAQKKGYSAAFVDAEHALDPRYAERLGVNISDLIISQPDFGEQALSIVESLVENKIKIIVVDSVAALVPKKELDGEMEDMHIGLQARMMGQALRKLVAITNKSKSLVVFINQTRDKIGGFAGTTTPGGKALKFYSSVRIDIRRLKTDKEKERSVANQVSAKVVKSKVCAPFRVARFAIKFGKGIDRKLELFEWGKKLKLLKRKGSYYSFEGVKGQGKNGFFKKLKKKTKQKKNFVRAVKEGILKTMK